MECVWREMNRRQFLRGAALDLQPLSAGEEKEGARLSQGLEPIFRS